MSKFHWIAAVVFVSLFSLSSYAADDADLFWKCSGSKTIGSETVSYSAKLWRQSSTLYTLTVSYASSAQPAPLFDDTVVLTNLYCRFTSLQQGSCVTANFRQSMDSMVNPKKPNLIQIEIIANKIVWPDSMKPRHQDGRFDFEVDLTESTTQCGLIL